MTQSETSDTIQREMTVDYVLERLDDLKGEINGLLEVLDPPHAPGYLDLPSGGSSAIEAIAGAVFKAEEVWRR